MAAGCHVSKSRPSRRSLAAIFLAAAVVTSVFFIDACNLIYDCGCRPLWAGAASHCNIHQPGSRHCPWCSVGTAGAAAIYFAVLGVQAAAVFLPSRVGTAARAAGALAAFPVAAALLGIAIGLLTGYWR